MAMTPWEREVGWLGSCRTLLRAVVLQGRERRMKREMKRRMKRRMERRTLRRTLRENFLFDWHKE